MKALILILLAATYAAAQSPTIADIARQERARRAGNTSTRVYTTDDIKTNRTADDANGAAPAPNPAVPSVSPAPAPNPAAPSVSPAPAAGVTAPEPPAEKDPQEEWFKVTDKLRQEARQLLDQEAATQLEISSTLNRVNAPVTNQSAKDQALADLSGAQSRLGVIRDQLSKKRSELQARELDGPPKK